MLPWYTQPQRSAPIDKELAFRHRKYEESRTQAADRGNQANDPQNRSTSRNPGTTRRKPLNKSSSARRIDMSPGAGNEGRRSSNGFSDALSRVRAPSRTQSELPDPSKGDTNKRRVKKVIDPRNWRKTPNEKLNPELQESPQPRRESSSTPHHRTQGMVPRESFGTSGPVSPRPLTMTERPISSHFGPPTIPPIPSNIPLDLEEDRPLSAQATGNSTYEGTPYYTQQTMRDFSSSPTDHLLKAQRRLAAIHHNIRLVDPNDSYLANCSDVEDAIQRLVQKFTHAHDGWTSMSTHNEELERRLQAFESTNAEYMALTLEVAELRKDKANFDENKRLKDELVSEIRSKSEHLRAQLDRDETAHCEALRRQKYDLHSSYRAEANRLQTEIENLRDDHTKSELRYTTDTSSLRSNLRNMKDFRDQSEIEVGRQKLEIINLRNTVSKNDEVKRGMRAEHEQEMREAEEKLRVLEEERNGTEGQFDEKLRLAKRTHMEQLQQLEAEFEFKVQKAMEQSESKRMASELYYKQGAENLAEGHATERREWSNQIDRLKEEKATLRDEEARSHEREKDSLRAEIDRLHGALNGSEDRARQKFSEEKQQMVRHYQRELKEAMSDTEALKGALTKRQIFKGIPDPVLESRFKKVANMVDQLSRQRWDSGRENSWPYPDSVLRGHENRRQLCQYVVQDAIWAILYQSIFNTPFGMFGDESAAVYGEWISTFGEDRSSVSVPHWPSATKTSEKFRYDAVQGFLDAVDQRSGGQSTENQRRKSAYMESTGVVAADIIQFLNWVAPTNGSHLSTAKDLVVQAAKLWLDIGVQHCRITIVIPRSSQKVKPRSGGSAGQLVVLPEVERLGDSQGAEFGMDPVTICKLETYRTGFM